VKRYQLIILLLAGGLLEALAFPLVIPQFSIRELDPVGHLEWLAWIGLVPILFALDGVRSWKRAFVMGLLAGVAFCYLTIYWVNHAMTAFGGLPFGLAFVALTLLVLYIAAHWAGAFAVSFLIRQRLGWPWWRHLPLVWVAFELLRNYLFTGYPWANLGYSQARHLVVSQLASLFGVYGIAGLVVLVNCVVYEMLAAPLDRRPLPWKPAIGALALVLLAVTYGYVHLSTVRARAAVAPQLRVGLVQGNIDQAVKNQREASADFILKRYVPLTEEADRAGADLVAWPEATFPYYVSPSISTFEGGRGKLPALQRAHLFLGVSTLEWKRDSTGKRIPAVTNTVLLVAPDLSVLQRYNKYHLVPFGEYVPLAKVLRFLKHIVPSLAPTSPGRELVVMRFPVKGAPPGDVASVAPMICYDAIFPEIAAAYARQDPEILLNPTNDAWYGYSSGPYQFLNIVRLRAIETGKAVARPSYAGVTALILPTGEVAPGAIDLGPVDPDLAPNRDEPPRLLVGEVPRLHGKTLYTSIGDLFAYASVLFAVGVFVYALRRRRMPAGG
jgi:apolipoprotein N-acyltransferase